MTTLLNGLLGGLLVGVAATLAVEVVGEGRSAVSAILGVLSPETAGTARVWRITTAVLYGTIGGLALVAVELYALGVVGVPPTPLEAYGLAVAWAVLLLAAVAVAYRFVFRLRFDRDVLVDLLLFHAVYGLGLGLWIRMTWIT